MLAAAVLILQLASVTKASAPAVYSGEARETDIVAPRVEETVRIDGVLDENAWRTASLLTRFSQYEPSDGRPAEDSTQVLVFYTPTAIYFGIRAFESHGAEINATLADRDKIESDDYVQLLIDTFNDGRQALVFGVNPRGVQSDGTRSEGQAEKSNGLNSASARAPQIADLTPDYVYESKGRLTDYGYEVEVRIPFKSLSYQSGDKQDWKLNVLRRVQHSGHLNTWAPARRSEGSFLAQSGRLVGLTELHRGMVFDLNPSITGKLNGALQTPTGAFRYDDPTPDFGLNVRAGLTTNLSFGGTVNPDFSQVEADVGQITSNQRFEISVPEKRPFFLEGIEKFETPNQLIYTRRILDPVAGAKIAGKVAGTNVGFLSAVDGEVASVQPNASHPVVNMLRLRRDVGTQSTVGLAYTDRVDGSDFNRVGALDARLVFKRQYYLQVQAGGSVTRIAGTTKTAPLWEGIFNRSGRRINLNWKVTGVHPDFQTLSGFVPRRNYMLGNFNNKVSWYGKRGSTIESWTNGLLLQGYWGYNALGEKPIESKIHFQNNFNLKGGWVGSITFGWETYAFDKARYANYYIVPLRDGPSSDTIRYPSRERIDDVHGIIMRFSTPEWGRFSASVGANIWDDAGFVEAVGVHLLRTNAEVNWRPTDKVRINGLLNRLELRRRYDNSRLSVQMIPRIKIEYQIARPIFIRYVGQYNANEQAALRDPVTRQPILIKSGSKYTPATRTVSNSLRNDWLFSYAPTPGTVIFVGYGASMTEPDSFRFDELTRTADGFFVKLSYLFRR